MPFDRIFLPNRLSRGWSLSGITRFASGFPVTRVNNAPGTPGNAKRRFFYDPGVDNYDMALAKNLLLTGSKSVLFRIEAFNVSTTRSSPARKQSMETSAV